MQSGLAEFKNNPAWGLAAFTSYDIFWLSVVAILLPPERGLAKATDKRFAGASAGFPAMSAALNAAFGRTILSTGAKAR